MAVVQLYLVSAYIDQIFLKDLGDYRTIGNKGSCFLSPKALYLNFQVF